MRSTSVLALLFVCALVTSGCSGIGQATSSLPVTPSGASGASSGAVALATPAENLAPAVSATTAASMSTRRAAAVRSSVAMATFKFPSDFPSAAIAGAQQRFAEAAWDQGGASSPVLKLDGPGCNGAKVFAYTRSDGTSVAVVYVPTGVAIASGWVSVNFGLKARVPLTAIYGTSWADQSPGIGATATMYFTMSRVVLFDLVGTGSAAPSPPPSASPTVSPSPSASPSVSPKPSASPTISPKPSASPTISPKPTPTPVKTASPAPTAAPVDVTSCTHFVSNPVCHQLPAHPAVSPYSAAWAALLFQAGRAYVPSFSAEPGPDPFHNTNDSSDPPLDELKAGGASIVQTIQCNAAWGPTVCASHGLQGTAIAVPTGMEPAGNSDHHYSFNDDARQREVDFWDAQGVPTTPGANLYIGAGGVCAWSGDGTGCSGSDATNIAQSLGSIDEADYQRGEAGPNASFGHAISLSALCADPSYVYPATASDGTNTNGTSACSGHTGTNARPPEGTRVYLDMSDAQVNAMSLPAYAKAWWRTLDREHEGGFIADTNWSGAPGLSPAYQRDNFSQQAREAGVTVAPYAQVPMGLGTINMAQSIKFCSNGTC